MGLFNRPVRFLILLLAFAIIGYVSYTSFYAIPINRNIYNPSNQEYIDPRRPYGPFKKPKTFPPTYNFRWQWDDINPEDTYHPNPKFKAAFVTFVRGDNMAKLKFTMRSLEDTFNRNLHYPYIIFSDQELTDEFKQKAATMTKSTVLFPGIPDDLWDYPAHTDKKKAAKARDDMAAKEIIFGGSEDYRLQSHFWAGPVFQHPALKDYDYTWRFEAGSEYLCTLDFDPFDYMFKHNKKLSFSIALLEYNATIPTIWKEAKRFMKEHKELIVGGKSKGGALDFVRTEDGGYNLCHFWSNFQIGSLKFFRSNAYQTFWNFMDRTNGIFYERWGDPIIHTLAASLLLRKDEVHHWEDIGYEVKPFVHCPNTPSGREGADIGDGASGYRKCACKPWENFDFNGYSCLKHWQNA